MCINLVNLMKVITAQHLVLHNLVDAFKDVNEHRLTKVNWPWDGLLSYSCIKEGDCHRTQRGRPQP